MFNKLLLLAIALPAFAQPGILSTVAGTGTRGYSGDGGPAANAQIAAGAGATLAVTTDPQGNLVIIDGGNSRIRKVDAAGIISTVAGGGTAPGPGDGGQATQARLTPNGAAYDAAGNLYILQGNQVRKVDPSGILSTIAGNGGINHAGDGGPALSASFLATSIAVDPAGNIYLSDSLAHRIRKIDADGIISTLAGTGVQGFSGDGGPASQATLTLPQGLATDANGNVFFCSLNRVRKVDPNGTITTVAGNGSPLALGDGGPAGAAGTTPVSLALDMEGNLFIAEPGANKIRKVNSAGIITTVAGTGIPGFTGDGGPASEARLFGPTSVAADPFGNVYFADTNNVRIRKISSGSSASPILATPASFSFSYTLGAPAPPPQTTVIISPGATLSFAASTTAPWLSVSPDSGTVNTVLSLTVDPAGLAPGIYNANLVLAPSGSGNVPLNLPVRLTINTPALTGIISTIGGNGLIPYSAPNAVATRAGFGVSGVAVDPSGNTFVADLISNRILKIDPAGALSLYAGNGSISFAGDGGPGPSGAFFFPTSVAAAPDGSLYIADTQNSRVRKIDPAGNLSTVASGLLTPSAVATDAAGNVYIADTGNGRVRKLTPAGENTIVAGTALPGSAGDGGPATSASLFLPGGLAVDAAGNLFIADVGNNKIRKVTPAGVISTVAGTGTKGFSGDGGPAPAATLNLLGTHAGLAVDSAGNLFIPDTANNRIRRVDSAGLISTVAGNGIAGFSGDGSPATTAGLNNPTAVALDAAGNLYIADSLNRRIRKVTFPATSPPPAITSSGVVNGASFSSTLAANSWVTILGSALSPTTNTWTNAISAGRLPTSLDGVSVSVAGKPAYIFFISPQQLNVLLPDLPPGPAELIVRTPSGPSSTINVTIAAAAPAFFQWPDGQPVATRQDFSFVAKPGTFPAAATTAARPGDVLILWGTGFGPTAPAAPAGTQTPADRTYSVLNPPQLTLNNQPITVYGAALAPGFAGLYQIAIQVPSTLSNGDWPLLNTRLAVRSQ
jgi:uncharacterized protein (TIGR03437 family)